MPLPTFPTNNDTKKPRNKKRNMIKSEELTELDFWTLVDKARRTTKEYFGDFVEVCGIINAKSGICSEDCKFCAQSSRYNTDVEIYPLKEVDTIVESAKRAGESGAKRFGIVTSGRSISEREVETIAKAIEIIGRELSIETCASLGGLTERKFRILKQAGLGRYHHNIETSPDYYGTIVTTHTIVERINTIKLAKSMGYQVCSGVIIGLGENEAERVKMALLLEDLNVDSVPINILVPIKGTPLENVKRISIKEIIRTIALFRIILQDKIIKIAAGREAVLGDFQALGFIAGANGFITGDYLTIKGRTPEEDRVFLNELKELL